jgi:hypothetical protein
LRDWLRNGWADKHQTSPEEIADLLAIVERDLADCQTEGLSPEWRLNIAYNASLQAAVAALAAAGFRASREAYHFRVIQSLAYTLQWDGQTISQLDRFRKKRNLSGYERAGMTSEQEAEEMLQLAIQLRDQVQAWLRRNYPKLMKK